ncbi:M20/M25/M40 family metallo-hydrolase [Brachybacterium saurashtrense]|uniref:M20/M25/M40 family metallo-hydrolase n=1 Tax=Brachybacterium saurashtrense TaxID=556288 RepID=A0A345YSN6_9MICO|nr:M20/M25/M40 family metallo-hydrolase [Brachybacterium saurashtrense]AXK46938.1 M20/M25/M40 family metallo-hydrolase [Brachybacterium saurashtrense]RRR22653.1 M20/M25/M40 family metallo-hydrolase [Brachybacterium saurashtrense]
MPIAAPTPDELALLQDEAVRFTRELIRIDTSNFGGNDPATWGNGETEAAEHVVALLREVGLEPTVVESAPGRPSVLVTLPGEDRERGGLILHGHLDVVPARAEDWSVDPFAAEIIDGMIYGRGAVDMKDMVGMILAVARHLARSGQRPPRDLMFAFFADEENASVWGAQWLVENRPELFEGMTEAISEVGGYSITLPEQETGKDVRAYLVQTAEKGLAWGRLRAHGRAGHGSVPNDENAIVRLARAITAIDEHEFPQECIASVRALFDGITEITGTGWDESDIERFLPLTGGARQFVTGTLRDSANLTMLESGYKVNVIPQTAEAGFDCRFLPGHQEQVLALLDELAGEHVEVIVDHVGVSVDSPRESPLVDAMADAIGAEDPGARILPYCLSAGTDNKPLSALGIGGYGFAPLQLPPDLDFAPLFHGVDERVPVDAVRFGARVLLRLVASS